MTMYNVCKFAKECPIYKGEEKIENMPLHIYKNVFCQRGRSGWNNCERFHEYFSNSPGKKK